MTRILPFNVARLAHERCRALHEPQEVMRKEVPSLRGIQDNLIAAGGASAVCFPWSSIVMNGSSEDHGFLDDAGGPRLRSRAELAAEHPTHPRLAQLNQAVLGVHQDCADLRAVLQLCWSVSGLQYSAQDFRKHRLICLLSADACLFLPGSKVSFSDRIKVLRPLQSGQAFLRRHLEEDFPEDVLLLPFVAVHDGRRSHHRDLAARSNRPERLRRLIGAALHDPCPVLDPLE